MERLIIAFIAAVALGGCASAHVDQAYLNRVIMDTPTAWDIPADKAPEIRAKAMGFIAAYATLGLGDVNDDMVSSIHAVAGKGGYNYAVRIIPAGDHARITVKCWASGERLTTIDTVRNAGILADYLRGGELRAEYISR